MERPKGELGTKKDLVLYRLQTSRDALKSAEILFAAEEYKGANNRAYYAINVVHALNGKAYKRYTQCQIVHLIIPLLFLIYH